MDLDDFFIDKYEVSNQEYLEFVSSGGYLNQEFWKFRFLRHGREIPWPEAMREFVDHTRLPGPRGWSNGTSAGATSATGSSTT